jgi:hypothetical protein
MDNVDDMDEKDLSKLKELEKLLVDKFCPISFVLLASEGKGADFFMKNTVKMRITRLEEPAKQLAFDYFKKIGVKGDYFEELEDITGSNFEYLTEIAPINKDVGSYKYSFFYDVKRKVEAKIKQGITEWLDQKKYPEIKTVCDGIVKRGAITLKEFNRITKTEAKQINGRPTDWSGKCLKSRLFKVNENVLREPMVYFRNRATTSFFTRGSKFGSLDYIWDYYVDE